MPRNRDTANGLREERPQAAINAIAPGQNITYYIQQLMDIEYDVRRFHLAQYEPIVHWLVDSVIYLVKHYPHMDVVILTIPDRYEASALARLNSMKTGLRRVKEEFGDGPTNQKAGQTFSKQSYGQRNRDRNFNGGRYRLRNNGQGQQWFSTPVCLAN